MTAALTVSSLLDGARSAAQLSDFGDTWFVEPLETLIDAINAEAHLTAPDAQPVQRIVGGLIDRLRKVDLLKRHPEIFDQKVEVAGAILGLPRTGSTMLHRLLGAGSQLTATRWWEAAFPLPMPDEIAGDPSPRIEAAKAAVEGFYAAWPDFRAIHPMDALAHDEEVILLDKTFVSTTYDSIMQIPSYGFAMPGMDKRRSYLELHEWLQILQWQRPEHRGRKWILKSPHHLLGGLDGLLDVFPQCRIIMTHRAIEECLPSYCSMCASLTVGHTRDFEPDWLGNYWSRRFEQGLRTLMERRSRLPAEHFIDVRYRDLIADTIPETLRVLAALGLPANAADEEAMTAWLATNGRENRPPHHYTGTDFCLSENAMRARFAFYTDAFLTEPRGHT